MACKECKSRGKTWNGSDPKCAFESDTFSENNWNCATMNKLRDLAEDNGLYCRHADESVGIVPTECGFIVMTWYKNRGQTGNALFMLDNEKEKPLTIKEAEYAIEYWEELNEKVVH